jgi:AbrB family looped-hinge helix DNA binding protein
MRVTSKGQVTIPVEVRERAGLLPGTEVAFEVDGDSVRLVKATGGRETRPC